MQNAKIYNNTGPLFLLAMSLGMTACGGGSGPAPAPGDIPSAPTPAPPAPSPPPPAPSPPPPAPAPTPIPMPGAAPQIGGCEVFPATAVFNTRIDDAQRFPVHASSATWINSIGTTRAFHPDWGTNDNPQRPDDYYGIPYNVVDGSGAATATTSWPTVAFNPTDPRAGSGDGVPDESDCAVPTANPSGVAYTVVRNCAPLAPPDRRFPFPRDDLLKAEGGACNDARQCGDRHVLVVEQGSCRLWESYATYQLGGQWYSYSTAAWELKSNAMRPDTWTSGDAAGLPILPLLAKAAEANAGEIRHALRVTLRDSVMARSYVWPARHRAGGDTPGGVPFGAVLRLKASFVPPVVWTEQAKEVAVAMQRYGLYVADIGSDLYVQGEPSARWQDGTISNLKTLRAADFEFVDMGTITSDNRFNGNSFQGSW